MIEIQLHSICAHYGLYGNAPVRRYAGDVDTMRAMLDFYARMLPHVQARSAAQFHGTPIGGALSDGAALYNEVITQFGTYQLKITTDLSIYNII